MPCRSGSPSTVPLAFSPDRLMRAARGHRQARTYRDLSANPAWSLLCRSRAARGTIASRLRGLADIAERLGSGSLRLTVWQNLLLSDIAENQLPAALAAIEGLGLGTSASAIRGGMVACTGNIGCRFALSDTKRHGVDLVDYLDRRLTLDQPLNIHLTGCPNSCAQHYVGDIGLLATKVEKSDEEEVEGYHVLIGGRSGGDAKLGREIYRAIPADEVA